MVVVVSGSCVGNDIVGVTAEQDEIELGVVKQGMMSHGDTR